MIKNAKHNRSKIVKTELNAWIKSKNELSYNVTHWKSSYKSQNISEMELKTEAPAIKKNRFPLIIAGPETWVLSSPLTHTLSNTITSVNLFKTKGD